jgi:hypothetical protein
MTSVKKMGLGAAVLASAASLAFAGAAQAVVIDQVPTGDLQLCGNVVDSSGNGVANVPIDGWLTSNPSSHFPGTPTLTNSQGGYCIQATTAQGIAVQFMGDSVNIHAHGTLPGSYTTLTPTVTMPINSTAFAALKHPTWNSAWKVNFVIS